MKALIKPKYTSAQLVVSASDPRVFYQFFCHLLTVDFSNYSCSDPGFFVGNRWYTIGLSVATNDLGVPGIKYIFFRLKLGTYDVYFRGKFLMNHTMYATDNSIALYPSNSSSPYFSLFGQNNISSPHAIARLSFFDTTFDQSAMANAMGSTSSKKKNFPFF
jgi:hypothetical protein